MGNTLSVIITYYLRKGLLEECVESVKRHLPESPLLVIDTKGNLSRARNQAVRMVRTPFFLLMEEDFLLPDATQVHNLFSILEQDQEVDVAAGVYLNIHPNAAIRATHFAADLETFRETLHAWPASKPWKATKDGVYYQQADTVENFFVARTDSLREGHWQEDVPIGGDHLAWCLAVKESGHASLVWSPDSFVIHRRKWGTTSRYEKMRRRDNMDTVKRRFGFNQMQEHGSWREMPVCPRWLHHPTVKRVIGSLRSEMQDIAGKQAN